MTQLKQDKKLKLRILTPKRGLSASQEKLVRKLETLDINRAVAEELVRASHPKAIKKWIAAVSKMGNRK